MSMYEQAFGDPLTGKRLFVDTLWSLRTASGILDAPSSSYDDEQTLRSQKVEQATAFIASGFRCLVA